MVVPILATKLYILPPPPKAVLRPHLLERLNGGLQRKLSIIVAPAGCGKTTLLSAWVAACNRPVAWLSLDAEDSDPARFLTYLIAALRTVMPHIGEGALGLLQSPQAPPSQVVLTAILNEISTGPNNFLLVLDDYHVIDAQAIDDALTFLIEHLPAQLHLVIASREDPPLPLARLRARGQLTELRASDLRFSPSEAAGFLQSMDLSLSAEHVAALEARTEGWIAGLQLAALSLQGHPDVAGFIRAFAGDNRYIADYLVEEVLERQPEPVRSFLLQTSILERLHGPLCDAVTGRQDGQALLAALERGNFFLVPLDERRQWYRYHHLFADVLATHLKAEQPGQVATLHQRVSAWYERNGSAADAIHHALAARDFERAADLVELAAPALRRSRQEATLLGWFKALPDALFRYRPVLNAAYADSLLATGELNDVEERLQDSERWLKQSAGVRALPYAEGSRPAGAMVVVDDDAFRRLPGAIAVHRAALTLALGDVPEAVRRARRALELVPEEDHLWRGAATTLLGLSSWADGDLKAAYESYAAGMARLQKAGNISDAVGGAITLADILIAQGRLREAMRIYEQGLQLAAAHGDAAMRGTADMYVGMSVLQLEHNDLPAATQYLLRSEQQGEHTGFPQHPYRRRVAMAGIRLAQGDRDGALELLGEAERLYVSDFHPDVRPVAALKARVWVAQGKLGEALGWARERGLSAGDELSYLREFEHITLARILLARHRSDGTEGYLQQALDLLQRLLQAAEKGGRMGSVIEILVLQALARQLQGDTHAALLPLERALALAEPEGYVRTFVDEGPLMAILLQAAVKRGIAPSYVHRLLAALGPSGHPAEERPPVKQGLIEPLSERELEVLRLLRTDLSGPEIARELTVSLHTIHSHIRNIYMKLGMNNRRAAVRRAEELGLL